MAGKSLNVAIIGAGISGLAAAAALGRRGIEVNVYEQASRFARVGAGIQMTPNAMKVLRGIGLEEHLRDVAFEPNQGFNRDHDTGNFTNTLQLGGVSEERYGAPYLLMHRADLHQAIASTVPEELIHRGRKLQSLSQDAGGVALRFEDGSEVLADAVIAADGVHSLVRELMLGPEKPHFTGKVAYRTTYPMSRLGDLKIGAGRTKWWGPDRHIVIYPTTRNSDEIYFVTSQPEKADWVTRESWSQKGDLDELREVFAAFHPEVRAVLNACPEVYKWALLEREPLPTWVDRRVALLGDACHPMTPYMAQGAAMALEDSVMLSRCFSEIDHGELKNGADAAAVNRVLRRYEATRKPRASEIQGTSRQNTWMRRETDPRWVYGYDAWSAELAA